jgi:hypothetical protein
VLVVDSSVWIDFFNDAEPALSAAQRNRGLRGWRH